ncbi:MAG: hypothetical protein IKT39_04275 [Clostridia bacterium]|nr:hypothetical protein [Clostridia bacterium]
MNWPRVKTILIFLFLAVDIMLLCSIIIPSVTLSRIPQETIRNTADVLSQRGIEISPEIIPARRESMGIVELYNIWPDKEAVAEKLLGKAPVLSGEVYKNGTKTLTFQQDGFNYKNSATVKTVAHELIEMGIDVRDNFYEEGESSLRSWQTIEDKKLFESEIYAAQTGAEVTVTGYWIFSDRENGIIINTPDTLLDVTGVLIDFINNPLREPEVKITSVETGYSAGTAYRDMSHKLVSVSPAYKISTDTGAYYIYDALSGNFLYACKNGEIIY